MSALFIAFSVGWFVLALALVGGVYRMRTPGTSKRKYHNQKGHTMKLKDARKQGLDGLELKKRVNSFSEARQFVEMVVAAGVARCTSPERDALCNNPARDIFWNDQAEWYACCGAHYIGGPQFTGSTRWRGSVVRIIVDPELAIPWLKEQPAVFKENLRGKWYRREA